jgi:hypothetical protein
MSGRQRSPAHTGQWQTLLSIAGILVSVASVHCSQEPDERAPQSAYTTFFREFKNGADCARLFELRNEARATTSQARQRDMNLKLRLVQCNSPTSHRVEPTSNDGDFTVREFRIYRAVVGAPMKVSEAEAIQEAARRFGVSEAEAKSITDRVMNTLSRKKWLGDAENEIRHARDWPGE